MGDRDRNRNRQSVGSVAAWRPARFRSRFRFRFRGSGALMTEAPDEAIATVSAMPPARQLLVSIIIPAYNERETIAEALRRVRAVDCEKEIIVVDDASTDGTSDILEQEAGILLV